MPVPDLVLAEPLLQERAPRDARQLLTVLTFVGLSIGLLLSSVPVTTEDGNHQQESDVALDLANAQPPTAGKSQRSVQPARTLHYLQPTRPLHSLPAMRPYQSLQTVIPWESVQTGRPELSVQARASATPGHYRRKQRAVPAQPRNVAHASGRMEGLDWVVMKFGGTSVATPDRWAVIIEQMKKVRAAGQRPWVAISALSQVTNRLNKAVEEALEDQATWQEGSSYLWIYSRHMQLADGLGVASDTEGMAPLMTLLEELKRLLEGIRLTRLVSPELRARVSAFGELMSTQLGILAINKAGIPCVRLDSRKLLRATETPNQQDEDRFMSATVEPIFAGDRVAAELKAAGAVTSMDPQTASAVLAQGFIGSTPKGATCLLGRGGSDTSGALLAALMGAVRYEIWTDVHGLFTSDPRYVDGTRHIKTTNYRMAQELASMGAKVLHDRCLAPAAWANIPVEVHNTADPDGPITRIAADDVDPNVKKPSRILGVTQRTGQVLLTVSITDAMWGEAGFLTSVFAPFGDLDVSVDLVAVSTYAVSLTLDYIPGGIHGEVFSKLMGQLSQLGKVETKAPVAVVSIIGENLRDALPEMGIALEELRERNIYMMSQSSEDLNLSFVVDEDQAKLLVQGLHNRLLAAGSGGDKKSMIDERVFGQTWDELKTDFLKVEAAAR